jgi:hypothetical protein
LKISLLQPKLWLFKDDNFRRLKFQNFFTVNYYIKTTKSTAPLSLKNSLFSLYFSYISRYLNETWYIYVTWPALFIYDLQFNGSLFLRFLCKDKIQKKNECSYFYFYIYSHSFIILALDNTHDTYILNWYTKTFI